MNTLRIRGRTCLLLATISILLFTWELLGTVTVAFSVHCGHTALLASATFACHRSFPGLKDVSGLMLQNDSDLHAQWHMTPSAINQDLFSPSMV